MSTPDEGADPVADHAAEYAACRARFRAVLADVDDAAASSVVVPTCPAWTVHDLVAHVTGIAAAIVARDNPPPGDNQAWVDAQVAVRREVPLADILDEWDEAGPTFDALLGRKPKAFGGLLYDAVAHEHDLRGALDRPGARDSGGIDISNAILVSLVRGDLATHGPVPGTLRLVAGGRSWELGQGAPVAALDTSAFELMRLLGSRRSRAQVLAAGWDGDPEPFLAALAHMPLPPADIIE